MYVIFMGLFEQICKNEALRDSAWVSFHYVEVLTKILLSYSK